MHPVGIGAFVQGDEQGAAREAGGQRGTHGRQVAGRGKGGVIEGAAQPSRNACRFPCGGEVEREQVAGDLGKHRRLSGDQAGDEQGDAHTRGGWRCQGERDGARWRQTRCDTVDGKHPRATPLCTGDLSTHTVSEELPVSVPLFPICPPLSQPGGRGLGG